VACETIQRQILANDDYLTYVPYWCNFLGKYPSDPEVNIGGLYPKGRSHLQERPFLRFSHQRACARRIPTTRCRDVNLRPDADSQGTLPAGGAEHRISQGFELTSIKAIQVPAVIIRLNEVFGPCGIGWRYTYSPFEELHSDNGWVEIVTEVAFQYRFPRHQRLRWLRLGGAAPRPAPSALAVSRRPHRRRQVGEAVLMDRRSCCRCGSLVARREPGPLPGALQFLPGDPLCHRDQDGSAPVHLPHVASTVSTKGKDFAIE
jgi:hypothetical protein